MKNNLITGAEIKAGLHYAAETVKKTGVSALHGAGAVDRAVTEFSLALQGNDGLSSLVASTDRATRLSLVHALQVAIDTGLSLNPNHGEACIVPIKGKCAFWPMKNGLIKKMLDNKNVKCVSVRTVREADDFKIVATGAGDDFTHTIALSNRGEHVGYYASCTFTDGTCVLSYMSVDDVLEHKKKHPPKTLNISDEEYGQKTVLKRLARKKFIGSIEDKDKVIFEAEGPILQGVEFADVESIETIDPPKKMTGTKAASAALDSKMKEIESKPQKPVPIPQDNNDSVIDTSALY